MKEGVVFDVRRHSLHDGPGIRTVFFFKGCPLACAWCHNPEGFAPEPEAIRRLERCISCHACRDLPPAQLCGANEVCPTAALETIGRRLTVDQVTAIARRDEAYYAESGGGVTFSGGEPLAQPEFLLACLDACRGEVLPTAVDTAAFAPEAQVREAARLTDLWLLDLKFMDEAEHRRWTGQSNRPVLANFEVLAAAGARAIVSVPLIPGINDDPADLAARAGFLKGLGCDWPVRLLPYHAAALGKYARQGRVFSLAGLAPPDAGAIERAARSFTSRGISVTVGGLA
jgi:pyruvate formate lyase activating enzyme